MNDETLRTLQLCGLNILKEFIKICDENNLKYYLSNGTLLGAVRHKGFIPWDEDIDVYMIREDYEKFLRIANDFLPSNLKMHNFRNDPNHKLYQTVIMDNRYKVKLNHTKNGVIRSPWMDIWPIDTMPKNKIAFTIRKYKILYRRFRFQASVFDTWANINKKRNLIERILVFLVNDLGMWKKSDPKKMLEKFDKELKKKVRKPKYYLNGISYYKFKDVMPIEIYGEGKKYQFEDLIVNGPVDYDYYLTKLYGDYMTPPPDADKNRYGIEFINTDEDENNV